MQGGTAFPLRGRWHATGNKGVTDEVFFRKPPFFKQADNIRPCGNCDDICKKENGLPRLLRRLAMTRQCHSERSEESVFPDRR